jgi:hypothetical protein
MGRGGPSSRVGKSSSAPEPFALNALYRANLARSPARSAHRGPLNKARPDGPTRPGPLVEPAGVPNCCGGAASSGRRLCGPFKRRASWCPRRPPPPHTDGLTQQIVIVQLTGIMQARRLARDVPSRLCKLVLMRMRVRNARPAQPGDGHHCCPRRLTFKANYHI